MTSTERFRVGKINSSLYNTHYISISQDIYNITIIHLVWVNILRPKVTVVTYGDTQQLGCHGTDMEGGKWFVYIPVLQVLGDSE